MPKKKVQESYSYVAIAIGPDDDEHCGECMHLDRAETWCDLFNDRVAWGNRFEDCEHCGHSEQVGVYERCDWCIENEVVYK